MRESEALREVTRLFAAFPGAKVTASTARAYAEQLLLLRSPEALHDAVDALIRSERWLPTVSMLLDEYPRYAEKYAPRALPPPELTEDEMALNRRRVAAISRHMSEHRGSMVECRDPECVWATTGENG